MKIKAIAESFNIERSEFEQFLIAHKLRFSKSFFSGINVDDTDVDRYVQLFREEKEKIEEQERLRIEEETRRKKEEAARKKAEEVARIKAEKEASKKAEEEARKKAEEDVLRKAAEDALRNEKIAAAFAEYVEAENLEKEELKLLTDEERRTYIMANSVKLCREKLTGTWAQSGASYADGDIFGLWLREFSYSGTDGETQNAVSKLNNTFTYRVFVTGDESGRCMLYVCGNPNGFTATIGEIAFTDDNNSFTLLCKNSSFLFERV